MDFFKFTDSTPTDLSNGQPFSGYKSAMWAERYARAGEFEFVAQLSSGLREFLPKGALISHVDTLDVGIVENHQIDEERDADPVLTITGRMFPSYLEQRIVGVNEAFGAPPAPFTEYTLASDNTWNQCVALINDHISIAGVVDNNDSLNDDILAATVTPGSGPTEARVIKRGTVYQRLLELLAIDKLGVRFVRKNPFGVYGDDTTSYLLIHHGVDRSADVIFSWDAGELESASYLFSNKADKNVALVQGRYTEELVQVGSNFNYDRRILLVDASDIDGSLDTVPTGATLTDIRDKMRVRGEEALADHNEVNIANTDIDPLTKYLYRRDFDIGDIVSIDGNYGNIEKRRVVEFVEIEDETGTTGLPTLEVL